ncbi:AIM24 family protein [Streptacidiphilus sp. ASG 303]|uniref:AIM24 family protein n=1 Tax=Streptacidiphilus sp. ASG 303 TaxID=2896847 RepID=UPI001E64FA3D|nr:AIM24 family protein [Streptacidiphilus sp. ASG 303]MCD0482833.1 AIM24 family protein [Streptacidiphilus sp. ASG 303]
MQSPLFGHTENRTDDRYALQNPQMLRVRLDGRSDVLARSGAMVAHTGRVAFTGWTPPGQGRRSGNPLVLELMRCSGEGTVYLANLAQHLHILDLQREKLTVTSPYVLALDSAVRWQVVNIQGGEHIAGVGAYSLELSGSGRVVLMTSGQPLVMRVEPGAYCYADADAVVAWSSQLDVQLQAQSRNTEVWRRRGTATEGWEMAFSGSGYVVVQPSELLPPQRVPLRVPAARPGPR